MTDAQLDMLCRAVESYQDARSKWDMPSDLVLLARQAVERAIEEIGGSEWDECISKIIELVDRQKQGA